MAPYALGRLFWRHTQVVLNLLESIYRAPINLFGLTVIEWHIVQELYVHDGQRPSELARQVGRPSTSFTSILDGLEEKTWILRRRDASDRRVVNIYLTAYAFQQQAEMQASVVAIENQLRLQINDDNLECMQAIQNKLENLTAK